MDLNEQVLDIVRKKGPIMPVQITKEVGNTLFAGAILSELVNSKKILISNAKIGGSPVYYFPGQESKLNILYAYLHEKEKKAYDLLKTKQILFDEQLEPVVRVALRNIKDFAVPLNVRNDGVQMIFWKWYLLSNQHAEMLIKKNLGLDDEKKEVELKKEMPVVEHIEQKKEEPVEPEKISEIKTEDVIIKPKDDKIKKEHVSNIEKPKRENKVNEENEEPKEIKNFVDTTDSFLQRIKKYFSRKDIDILDFKIIRKNSEIDFVINVPSAFGKVEYFCKAKAKKKNNEGDLSAAYLQGKMKNLSTIYLTTGEVTKKAKDKMNREFKGMVLKQI